MHLTQNMSLQNGQIEFTQVLGMSFDKHKIQMINNITSTSKHLPANIYLFSASALVLICFLFLSILFIFLFFILFFLSLSSYPSSYPFMFLSLRFRSAIRVCWARNKNSENGTYGLCYLFLQFLFVLINCSSDFLFYFVT